MMLRMIEIILALFLLLCNWLIMQYHLRLIRVSLVLAMLLVFSCDRPGQTTDLPATAGQVSIEVRFAGNKPMTEPINAGQTTLLELMSDMQQSNKLHFETSGKGDMTMIQSISEQPNEGAGDDKKNWLFSVNGQIAQKGAGQFQLQDGDQIVWCFLLWKDRNQCK